jgi:hypothetical protein
MTAKGILNFNLGLFPKGNTQENLTNFTLLLKNVVQDLI